MGAGKNKSKFQGTFEKFKNKKKGAGWKDKKDKPWRRPNRDGHEM